jgi:hypothetical protein
MALVLNGLPPDAKFISGIAIVPSEAPTVALSVLAFGGTKIG